MKMAVNGARAAMKGYKRILLLLAALWICTAGALAQEGDDGDIHWKLEGTTLTISPKDGVDQAAMPDKIELSTDAWRQYADVVKNLVITDKIIKIGEYG